MPANPNNDGFCEKSFDGIVRLFPLPGLVVFPHVVQALHIFEPRYRQMLEHAINDDKLIAMALLTSREDYYGSPPVDGVVCIGNVVSCDTLPDGCSNIILVGQRRAKIIRELDDDNLYRSAEVELLSDMVEESDPGNDALVEQLLDAYGKVLPKSGLATAQLAKSIGQPVSLALLTDLIAYTIEIPPPKKICLLAETNVCCRANKLIDLLEQMRPSCGPENHGNPQSFPPDFSAN